jgi:hypothetical protein
MFLIQRRTSTVHIPVDPKSSGLPHPTTGPSSCVSHIRKITSTPFGMGKQMNNKLSLRTVSTPSGRGGKAPGILDLRRRQIRLQNVAG